MSMLTCMKLYHEKRITVYMCPQEYEWTLPSSMQMSTVFQFNQWVLFLGFHLWHYLAVVEKSKRRLSCMKNTRYRNTMWTIPSQPDKSSVDRLTVVLVNECCWSQWKIIVSEWSQRPEFPINEQDNRQFDKERKRNSHWQVQLVWKSIDL